MALWVDLRANSNLKEIVVYKRNVVLTACLITLMTCGVPFSGVAATSIDEVKKNVEELWKPVKENQPHVTAVEFKKIMDGDEEYVLVDVRTEDEYKAAHLPGAIHISRGLVEWVAPKKIQDPGAKIFVYCRTGARSAFVTKRLRDMGYTDVTNIYDAFKGWVVAGYPVYNRHGEFTLKPECFEKKDPYVVD